MSDVLEWRKPASTPLDDQDAILVADGFGGRYAIRPDMGCYILYLAEDEFMFRTFNTINECKKYAESVTQDAVRCLYKKLGSGTDVPGDT